METITAPDGTTLAVRRTGEGTPVVLVHGSAGGLDSWDPVLPFLASFEAWVYARRGYPPSGGAAGKTLYAAGPSLVPVLDRFRALLAADQFPAADRLFAEEVARIPAEMLDALGEFPGDPSSWSPACTTSRRWPPTIPISAGGPASTSRRC